VTDRLLTGATDRPTAATSYSVNGVDLEALAQRVADLVADRLAVGPPLVDAETLARHLGVERSYVYGHAVELGAIRLGSGRKARLRFNVAEVERRLTCSLSRGSEAAKTRVVEPNRRRRRTRPLGTGRIAAHSRD
jgi:hypothetical protein